MSFSRNVLIPDYGEMGSFRSYLRDISTGGTLLTIPSDIDSNGLNHLPMDTKGQSNNLNLDLPKRGSKEDIDRFRVEVYFYPEKTI